jgi:hypothetical protein
VAIIHSFRPNIVPHIPNRAWVEFVGDHALFFVSGYDELHA